VKVDTDKLQVTMVTEHKLRIAVSDNKNCKSDLCGLSMTRQCGYAAKGVEAPIRSSTMLTTVFSLSHIMQQANLGTEVG